MRFCTAAKVLLLQRVAYIFWNFCCNVASGYPLNFQIFNFFLKGNLAAASLCFTAANSYDILLPQVLLATASSLCPCYSLLGFFSILLCSFMLAVANIILTVASSYCLLELMVPRYSENQLAAVSNCYLLLAMSFLRHLKCTQTNTKTTATSTKHIK